MNTIVQRRRPTHSRIRPRLTNLIKKHTHVGVINGAVWSAHARLFPRG